VGDGDALITQRSQVQIAVLWYEARSHGFGERVPGRGAGHSAAHRRAPRSFPRLQDVDATLEIRRALLARFPYALVFLVREDEVRVLAVAHAKRRPGYWLSRVRRKG
jgi:toxin ParE1/3/4